MPAKKKLQVFVSSTYLDLKNERQAAVEAILKAGHIPAGMELFAAGNESQFETIKRWIDESDAYMLILGGRYGSVEPKTSLSYTELEYDYAISKNKPIFAVVITESALDQKVKTEGKVAIEAENPKELKSFRDKGLSRMSSFFNDSKDIKLAVHETLSDFMSGYEFNGWVSGAELTESRALIEEISRLQKRNKELEKELSQLKKNVDLETPKTSKWSDSEFKEIFDHLKATEIRTDYFDKSQPLSTYSVATLFHVLRDTLITGVTNQMGATDRSQLLYFNVLPKLNVYGLAALERVPGVAYQRYRLTPKGLALLAWIDKKTLFDVKPKKQNEPTVQRSTNSKT